MGGMELHGIRLTVGGLAHRAKLASFRLNRSTWIVPSVSSRSPARHIASRLCFVSGGLRTVAMKEASARCTRFARLLAITGSEASNALRANASSYKMTAFCIILEESHSLRTTGHGAPLASGRSKISTKRAFCIIASRAANTCRHRAFPGFSPPPFCVSGLYAKKPRIAPRFSAALSVDVNSATAYTWTTQRKVYPSVCLQTYYTTPGCRCQYLKGIFLLLK